MRTCQSPPPPDSRCVLSIHISFISHLNSGFVYSSLTCQQPTSPQLTKCKSKMLVKKKKTNTICPKIYSSSMLPNLGHGQGSSPVGHSLWASACERTDSLLLLCFSTVCQHCWHAYVPSNTTTFYRQAINWCVQHVAAAVFTHLAQAIEPSNDPSLSKASLEIRPRRRRTEGRKRRMQLNCCKM